MPDRLQHFSVHLIHIQSLASPPLIATRGVGLSELLSVSCSFVSAGQSLKVFSVPCQNKSCPEDSWNVSLFDIECLCTSSSSSPFMTGWVTVMFYWLLKLQKYLHTHKHTSGASRKACPLNHDCPSFRVEPYIWTYIFMLYFILSYLLGLCLWDIYVYL